MTEQFDMTMVEHLTELRRRIIWVLIVFVLSLLVGLYFAGPIINYLQSTPVSDEIPTNFNSFSPSDSLRVYMQFAFLVGIIITLPYGLLQVWGFVSPGLQPKERKVTLSFIPAAFFLFIIGILFGYYIVFPMIIMFLANVTVQIGGTPMYGIAEYFGFMFNMVLPFGFLFEMPIIVIFLTRLRILNPMRLAKMRRLAYFVLAIIAITITPPEFVSDIIVTVPLLILYELSIWLSRIVYRKQLLEDEKWENEQIIQD